ncbi:MAG TPA: hypothetical protein ENH23_05060 [candidate division Zixibacteria bacterium]|nr:hypothetical protein [candidate division Zixibacteria bacterium]
MTSEQIEYNERTNTWLPKKEKIRGTIGFQNTMAGGEPVISIDGFDISWEAFGKTMLTNEGFKFNLEFIDLADENKVSGITMGFSSHGKSVHLAR